MAVPIWLIGSVTAVEQAQHQEDPCQVLGSGQKSLLLSQPTLGPGLSQGPPSLTHFSAPYFPACLKIAH